MIHYIHNHKQTIETRSRITIFDIIFNDWISISIASVGIIADYFLRRIPYPNDRNSSRLFHHMDIDGDHKVDIREFQSYLIQLFHANDVVSFEFGRKVSPPEVAKQFSLWEPKTRNMRWNCLMDYFDDDKDLAIDYDEFKALKANKFDAFNCLLSRDIG
ncbi:unnamed protein product [Oppiella nova]|uniref:EF-hand domain-containing protein n=1 Tax=Oppiella nova TaxID=334625 RepID=A0A7R9QEB2_9ACAR|nr:unnamed protein product [Oppiella nova]CAG2164082.1 unnamed protein product [Oppiella nova]